MTKKDYQLIADIIRSMPYWTLEERKARKETTFRFADCLAEADDKFDRDEFVRNCWYC